MNADQKKAYDIGFAEQKAGVPRWDKTNFSIRNYSKFPSVGNVDVLYSYWLSGYDDSAKGLSAQTSLVKQAPAVPDDDILRNIIKQQMNRVNRTYTEQDMINWIALAKIQWRDLGEAANGDRLNLKLRDMFNSLPPQQVVQSASTTSSQPANTNTQGVSPDSLNIIVSQMNDTGQRASVAVSPLSEKVLVTGTYSLVTTFNLETSLLETLKQELLGNSAVSNLQSLAVAKKEMTLPIANKRIKILEFYTSDAIPIIQKQWRIDFEVLEDTVYAEDVVSGFATLAGVNPSFLSNSLITKKSENVTGVVGTSSSPFLVLGIVVLLGVVLVKLVK